MLDHQGVHWRTASCTQYRLAVTHGVLIDKIKEVLEQSSVGCTIDRRPDDQQVCSLN